MKTAAFLLASLCAIIFNSGSAQAATTNAVFACTPFVLDPGFSRITRAMYVPLTQFGIPGGTIALMLQKNGPTATNATAGGGITGVRGITLSELGYDINTSFSWCSKVNPRFNVSWTDGSFSSTGGCLVGTQTDLGNNWVRVRFNPQNPSQMFPVLPPGQTVDTIAVVLFEGTDATAGNGPKGICYLDNIEVNGVICKKTGLTPRPVRP